MIATYNSFAPVDTFGIDRSRSADVLVAVAGSLAIGLLAQIAIPIGPVPITGQTFGVLLIAVLFGRQRATAAVAAYIAEGTVGLPVFAGGTWGPAVLVGPTGGYLLGFLAAAYVVGLLCETPRASDRRRATFKGLGAVRIGAAVTLGHLLIYTFGVAGLTRFVEWPTVLTVGVVPFLAGDVLKTILVIAVVMLGMKGTDRWQVTRNHQQSS